MKNLFVALLLIIAAGAGAVYFTARSERDAATTADEGASPLEQGYDYYAQDMRATRFDRDGQPVSQLQAERVTHYPDGDRAELEEPSFKSFGVDSDAWQVSADTGTLAPDAQRPEDRLELAGRVELHKPQPAGDFIHVSTNALTVFPGAEEATTAAPVSLQMRDTRMNGDGMEARLAENYFHLNNVTGTHDPAPRP